MSVVINNSWFQYWQKKPKAHVRLFCFPYAGGGASIYRTWSECTPPEIEVCPIRLPGRENRLLETPFSDLSTLIVSLEQAILPYLDMPYAFFGHSMGALICFELARRIRLSRRDSGLLQLFVSGHRAPHIPDPDMPTYHLPDPAFIKELRRLQGTPEVLLDNKELMTLLLPLLRADFTICETYSYSEDEPLQYPIYAVGALQDSEVPLEWLAAWQAHTKSTFKFRMFDGNHFFLHKEQEALLQTISQTLFQWL